LVAAQDDDTRAFECVGDLARREDAVDARYVHVHEYDVGAKRRGERDRFGSVGGPADDGYVGTRGECLFEAEGKEVVIVGDQDFERPGVADKD
jgi:hypothetical protein